MKFQVVSTSLCPVNSIICQSFEQIFLINHPFSSYLKSIAFLNLLSRNVFLKIEPYPIHKESLCASELYFEKYIKNNNINCYIIHINEQIRPYMKSY